MTEEDDVATGEQAETGWIGRVEGWLGGNGWLERNGWPGTNSESVLGLEESVSSWANVLASGWRVVSQVRDIGLAAWNGREPEVVGDLLEELRGATEQLVASVPPAVTVVDDLEALDAKLQNAVEEGEASDALGAYLAWLEGLVERVVGYVVCRAFSDDDERHALLNVVHLERLFAACESVIDQVVRRWVVDETLDGVDPRGRG